MDNEIDSLEKRITTLKRCVNDEVNLMLKLQILLLSDDCTTRQKIIFEIVKKWHGERTLILSRQLEVLYCSMDWLKARFV